MDIYTKVVLTIIAVALSESRLEKLGLQPLHSRVPTPAVICGADANPRFSGQLGCARVFTDNNGIGRLLIAQ
jgi:hypothetical protein